MLASNLYKTKIMKLFFVAYPNLSIWHVKCGVWLHMSDQFWQSHLLIEKWEG